MAIEAGRVLNERYRLIRPVGQGSQASVWVAEHLALTTHVAVKLIDPELAKKETARERFRREATAAAQLRSAHVVQILDHGIDGDQPFIVMELLDGEDLFERLTHRGHLSMRETSKIVTQVARALSRAHAAGIIHRDLKPENVFLVPNEDDEQVKVLDFGVAKVKSAKTTRQTSVGTLIGTPHYMSPEQVKGTTEVDYRTDLWALGIITFQCVTGELPFDSEGVGELLIKISIGDIPVPSKFGAGITPAFDAWFARACERDPAKRFQSARELAVALATAVGGETARAPTVRPPPAAAAQAAPAKKSEIPAAPPRPAAIGSPPRPAAAAAKPFDAGARAASLLKHAEDELASEDLEEVSPFDDDDDDDAPTRMKLPPETDIDFDDEPEPPPVPALRPSHIEFPLVVRAGTPPGAPPAGAPVAAAPAAAAPAFAAPAPAAPVAATPAAAAPAPTPYGPSSVIVPKAAALPSIIAPVIDWPPAPSSVKTAPQPAPVSPPRPPRPPTPDVLPPPSRPIIPAHPRAPAMMSPPSTVSGLARPGLLPTDPPPEFDGTKRRRMVRYLIAGLVLAAAGITWTVVRSQLPSQPEPAAGGADTASAAAAPPAPPQPTESAASSAKAVDPGKVTRPARPTPTGVKGPIKRAPKKVPEGVIEIPDGPDEVPPAP